MFIDSIPAGSELAFEMALDRALSVEKEENPDSITYFEDLDLARRREGEYWSRDEDVAEIT